MLLGIVSDTHVKEGGKRQLAPQLLEALQGVDLILHAGDLNCLRVIRELELIAPVRAVHGNNEDALALSQLPRARLVEIEGARIGLAHGDVMQNGNASFSVAANALSHFAGEAVNCVVFGHSHRAFVGWHTRGDGGRVLLFNPGSAGKKRRAPQHSCGLLRVEGAHLDPQLVLWD